MKQLGTVMPGYRVNEYMLVLNPHEELSNRIWDLKKKFHEDYKIETAATKPTLMIASFVQYQMNEHRILHRLDLIAMAATPFKVELENFGSLPSHTIFINAKSKVPLQHLVKTIRSEAQSLMKFNEENKPYFANEPHFNIGKKLLPWQYEKAWLEYSHKHFTGRFIAEEMVLLKRTYGEDKWHPAKRFKFQNLPITVKQGSLIF